MAIDLGDSSNFILGAQASTDSTKDMIDENPNCDHNKWINISATSVSPGSCIP